MWNFELRVGITLYVEFNLQVVQFRVGLGVPEVLHISVTFNPCRMVTLVGFRVTVGRTRKKTHHKPVHTLINNHKLLLKKLSFLISTIVSLVLFFFKYLKVLNTCVVWNQFKSDFSEVVFVCHSGHSVHGMMSDVVFLGLMLLIEPLLQQTYKYT